MKKEKNIAEESIEEDVHEQQEEFSKIKESLEESLNKEEAQLEEVNTEEDEDNKYKRALADYQNLLKQTAKEKMDFVKYANEKMLYEIIPVYDNLKISISHTNKTTGDSWLEGVKYVVKQFKTALESAGVREIETTGKAFDHNIMEAVSSKEAEKKKQDHMVAEEIKSGYMLNDKVIIPAHVVVYKYEKK